MSPGDNALGLGQRILPMWAAHNVSYKAQRQLWDGFPESLLRVLAGWHQCELRVGSVSGSAHHYVSFYGIVAHYGKSLCAEFFKRPIFLLN